MTPTTPFCDLTTEHLEHLRNQARQMLRNAATLSTGLAEAMQANLEDIEAELASRMTA